MKQLTVTRTVTPEVAKRQTQHMVSHTRSKAARMANVLRAYHARCSGASGSGGRLVCALHLLPVEAWMLLGLHAFPVPLPAVGSVKGLL